MLRNGEGQKETSHVLSLQTTLEKNMRELNISIIEIHVHVIGVWSIILRKRQGVIEYGAEEDILASEDKVT